MILPDKVNVLGIEYTILYFDNPAEVDNEKRRALWGQVDYWDRIIRIYDNHRPVEDVFQVIVHEILHAIAKELHLDSLRGEDNHDDLDILALALSDVFIRNGWLEVERNNVV